MRKGNKERKITDIGWENKEQKNERNENENYYLLWWSDNKIFIIVSVSQTDNFLNAFNSIVLPLRFCTISS